MVLSSQDSDSDSVESFGELFTSTQLNKSTVTWDRNISDSVLSALPSQPPQQPDLLEEEEETVESPDVNCSSLPAARLEQSPSASSRKTASQLTANARRRSLGRRPSSDGGTEGAMDSASVFLPLLLPITL